MNKDQLLADLRQAEGFRDTAYLDTRGNWTGGYGHLLLPTSRNWAGEKFDQATILAWLSTDVDGAYAAACSLPEWPSLDCDPRQNAVVELVFNMGKGTWLEFSHTRAALGKKQWQMAYDALLNSDWRREVQPQGLTKPGRATRIASYILNGRF